MRENADWRPLDRVLEKIEKIDPNYFHFILERKSIAIKSYLKEITGQSVKVPKHPEYN